MSTIFDEVCELGFTIYPTQVMHDVEAQANTIMALHTLQETGLLNTAGDYVVRRAAMGVGAPSLRFTQGSREDLAEARAAAYYRAANDALCKYAQVNQNAAFAMAGTMAKECSDLLLRREVQIAQEATKH